MIINPLWKQVYIKLDEPKAGALDLSSRQTAVECAEVLAVGDGIDNIKVGDKVFVKAWAIDQVDHKGIRYCFVNLETNGLLATFYED